MDEHGVSNLSDLITASMTYEIGDGDDEKKLDIVIKLLPHDPFSRYFVTINQFDYREIQFYTRVSQNQFIIKYKEKEFFFRYSLSHSFQFNLFY